MAITVAEAWSRIHDWLSIHAPKILGNLNPPATDRQIDELQSSVSHEMPEEWRELYKGHNGMNSDANMGSLFCGMQFISLDDIVRRRQSDHPADANSSTVHAADTAIRRENLYNPKWIEFAHDFGDTSLCIDLDPTAAGTPGQVIFTDHAFDTVILLGGGIRSFLDAFVRDLESGKYFLSNDALADGDQFLVCDPEIDVMNWSFSPRWKHLAE